MDFGERLKSLRLDKGYTQQELSSIVGVSVVAVRSWEKNVKKPAMDALLSLGKALNVSMDTLMGFSLSTPKSSLVLSPAERKLLKNYQMLDSYGKKAVETLCAVEAERFFVRQGVNLQAVKTGEPKILRYIPHYTSPSAAGIAAPIDTTDAEMMAVDSNVPNDADYAVNIQGNSMEPYIHDGDVVYVQRTNELRVGDVGIFCVDGAMYCKQYYVDEGRNLILVSANPDLRNSNIIIRAESGRFVKVCGKVLLNSRVQLPDYLFE